MQKLDFVIPIIICEYVSCKHTNTMKNLKEANITILSDAIKSKKLVDRGE